MLNNALNPIAFSIGNFEVKWYAIILVAGMIAGLIYIILDGKRYKLSSDFAIECWLWCIVLAIIFARFFYVVAHPSTYFPIKSWDDFVNLFAIWNGGITILGGILGGILGAYIASVRYRRNFLMVCDYCAPAVLIGQIIGRWGNYVNQEAYGVVVTNPDLQWFPFSVYIDHTQQWHCATFFYEIVLNAIGFVALYLISRKVKHNGIIASGYIFWYCVVRAILETFRLDAVVTESGLRVTQLICIIFAVISFVIIILIQFKVFDKIDKKGWLLKESAVAAGDIPLEERKKGKKKELSEAVEGEDNYTVENNSDRFNEIVNGILEEKKKLKEENALKEESKKTEETVESVKDDLSEKSDFAGDKEEKSVTDNNDGNEKNSADGLSVKDGTLTDIENQSYLISDKENKNEIQEVKEADKKQILEEVVEVNSISDKENDKASDKAASVSSKKGTVSEKNKTTSKKVTVSSVKSSLNSGKGSKANGGSSKTGSIGSVKTDNQKKSKTADKTSSKSEGTDKGLKVKGNTEKKSSVSSESTVNKKTVKNSSSTAKSTPKSGTASSTAKSSSKSGTVKKD